MMERQEKIYVAGHKGLVGSAIVRELQKRGYTNLVLRTHDEVNLGNQQAVEYFFANERPDYVFLAAAKVGGIQANNTYPAEFIYNNLSIQTNVIQAAWKFGVRKLLFFGSSCAYPRECSQPMKEEYLLTGPLEQTNEPYAIAKIAGIKMCEAYNAQYGTSFLSIIPAGIYGPNDNFDPQNSHVLAALLRKFHEAKMTQAPHVLLWGSGRPKREFLHVDDLAAACVYLMNHKDFKEMVNVGSNQEMSIFELAHLLKEVVDYSGELIFDSSKPDGAPRKLLDSTRLHMLGWQPSIDFKEGLKETYGWFLKSNWNTFS